MTIVDAIRAAWLNPRFWSVIAIYAGIPLALALVAMWANITVADGVLVGFAAGALITTLSALVWEERDSV